MALIYRSNRILNFAQADLGGPPAVLVFMLISAWGVNWYLALAAGLPPSVVLGALVELVDHPSLPPAPRLILTVATIGLSQLLALQPRSCCRACGATNACSRRASTPPFDLQLRASSPIIFNANDADAP